MICYSKNLFYLLIFILLQGCAGSGVAPVTNRTKIKESSPVITTPSKNNKNKIPQKSVRKKIDCYVVAKGDTLKMMPVLKMINLVKIHLREK